MITALDVAAAAGVSKTTVSYVFSADKANLISEKTRNRVMATAARLGYQPSYLGRSLSTNRTFNIALVLPSRCGKNMSQHMLNIFHAIIKSSENSEYNLSIFLGDDKRLETSLQSRRIDGVIVVGLGSSTALLDHIASFKLPMVVVNRYYPVSQLVSCVRANLTEWVLNEIDFMQQSACRNIMVFNKSAQSDSGREITAAVQPKIKDNQTSCRIELATMEKNLREQFLSALQAPLKYDAFIINGNEGALLLQLAEKLNIVPGSFIVSNFYRVSGSSFTRLWHRNGYGMGGEAWKLLMKLLNGGQGECSILPVEQYSTVNDSNSDSEGGFDV